MSKSRKLTKLGVPPLCCWEANFADGRLSLLEITFRSDVRSTRGKKILHQNECRKKPSWKFFSDIERGLSRELQTPLVQIKPNTHLWSFDSNIDRDYIVNYGQFPTTIAKKIGCIFKNEIMVRDYKLAPFGFGASFSPVVDFVAL